MMHGQICGNGIRFITIWKLPITVQTEPFWYHSIDCEESSEHYAKLRSSYDSQDGDICLFNPLSEHFSR